MNHAKMKLVLICVVLTASAAYGKFPALNSEKETTEKSCDAVGCSAACYPMVGDCHVEQQCVCKMEQPKKTTTGSPTFLEASSPGSIRRNRRKSLYSCDFSQCNSSCWSTGIAFGGFCAYNVCNCNYVSQNDINRNLWITPSFPLIR